MKTGFLCLIILFFYGCEKSVDFTLKEAEPKLVVEATIENGAAPVVVLSNSLAYFSKITPELLVSSFVRGATVSVSNGSTTHILKEYTVPLSGGYNLYYYGIDSANLATAFTGELNKTYSLNIHYDGKAYSAVTEIPAFNKRLDSIRWKPRPGDTAEVSVLVKITDPSGYGDYVRYWTKKNKEAFLPGFTSVYDDLVIDGTTYELEVEPGVDRNADNDFGDNSFKRGDTVTLKISSIAKPTYDFWRTMEYTYASVGNPFSSPIKVSTNISNGALGYFGGYASQYKTIIIPK